MITFEDLCRGADPDEVRRIIKGSYRMTPKIENGRLIGWELESVTSTTPLEKETTK